MVYFLKKLKDEKLSNRCAVSAPLLMVLDEVDKLADGGRSADFGLFQAATLGREAGLQLLLTTQSLEQLYGLAPQFNEHLTTAGLAGFPMTVAFRPGTPPPCTRFRPSTDRTTASAPFSPSRGMTAPPRTANWSLSSARPSLPPSPPARHISSSQMPDP